MTLILWLDEKDSTCKEIKEFVINHSIECIIEKMKIFEKRTSGINILPYLMNLDTSRDFYRKEDIIKELSKYC